MQMPDWKIVGANQSRVVAIITLALALAIACSARPGLLNSERIERQFGSYGVEVLQADEHRRVTCLYSNDAAGRVCRTFAIVDFILPVDGRISAEHHSIVAGGSIGQVFRDSGWTIDKNTLSIRDSRPQDYSDNVAALMRIGEDQSLAVHQYRFDVVKGPLRIHYATITEVHHPAYLLTRQLHAIYD